MRWLLLVTLAAGCGRLGFDTPGDARGELVGDGRPGDGAGGGSSTIAPAQGSSVVVGSGPQTVTLTNPTTSGSLLVAVVAVNNSARRPRGSRRLRRRA